MTPSSSPALREYTLRAVVVGCAIGAVLAIGNVYMALKTGWADTGNFTAAVLGYVVLTSAGRGQVGALETNIVQVTAASAAAVCFTAGLVGAIPALALAGLAPSSALLFIWGAALTVLGVLIALGLRRRLVVDEALPFPTSVATAELITAMHGRTDAVLRARQLAYAASGAGIFTWFRDGWPAWIPAQTAITNTVAVTWSPMLLGTGVLIGVRNAASLVVGAVAAWIVIGPIVIARGSVESADLAGWLMWPGIALMVGAGIAFLLLQLRTFLGAASDVRASARQFVRDRTTVAAWIGALGGVVICSWLIFDVSPLYAAGAVLLSLLLAGVSSRALGQTDIAPLSQMGQLTQVIFGIVAPSHATANIVSASIVTGDATPTGSLLIAFKTGAKLGASTRAIVKAQLIGAAVGLAVTVPAYHLIAGAYGLASEALPAPIATATKGLAELATRGGDVLPPHAYIAVAIGGALGVAITLLARTRVRQLLPSPFALGLGFLIPVGTSLSIALGCTIAILIDRKRPRWSEGAGAAVAAGAIAGEALIGVVVAILLAIGLSR